MKKRVLILCTGNSARSQMAEGLLERDAGDRFEVESAGTKPGRVRPEAIAVMKELGIDITGHRSKHVDEFEGQSFDYVLTVCDNAKESCPVFPGHAGRIHNAFEDPAALQGTEEARLALFRRVRKSLKSGRVVLWLRVSPAEGNFPIPGGVSGFQASANLHRSRASWSVSDRSVCHPKCRDGGDLR